MVGCDPGEADGGYVFSGGNTNRDYELLVEAAEGLDHPVRIASTWTPTRPLPPTYTLDPPQDGERQVTVRRSGGTPLIYMAYHMPAGSAPDFAAVEMLSNVFGDTPASGRGVEAAIRPCQNARGVAHYLRDAFQPIGDHLGVFHEVGQWVDYAGDDGLFRKYRIVFIDGRPFAGHMAIADRWDVWYLNAGMSVSASKRREEEAFMRSFDINFARRHEVALTAMADWIGLDYFTVDCAESKNGSLLIFEADNTAIVHNMDPPNIFPYKAPQMRKIFHAFAAMLNRRARPVREKAA